MSIYKGYQRYSLKNITCRHTITIKLFPLNITPLSFLKRHQETDERRNRHDGLQLMSWGHLLGCGCANEAYMIPPASCSLLISRSVAPIGLRCSRRQIRTKPLGVAPWPHSHWPNSAQCVHSCRLVGWRSLNYYNSLGKTVACTRSASFKLNILDNCTTVR